jgi:hypothetical protein
LQACGRYFACCPALPHPARSHPALPGLQATVSAIVESKATEIAELRHQLQEAQLSVQVGHCTACQASLLPTQLAALPSSADRIPGMLAPALHTRHCPVVPAVLCSAVPAVQEAEEAAVAGAANEAERQQVQQRCKDLEAKVEEARRRIQVRAAQQ